MDYRLLFPSLYLSAHDLKGKDQTLTITHLAVEELRTEGGTEPKAILYFEETHKKAAAGKEKRLVLNKTNATTIAGQLGSETDDWKGKKIVLFPTQAQAFGATVDCIRVRPAVAAVEVK